MVLSTTVTSPMLRVVDGPPDLVADGPAGLQGVDRLLVEEHAADLAGAADELLVPLGLHGLLAADEPAAQHRGAAHLRERGQHREAGSAPTAGRARKAGLDPSPPLGRVVEELGGGRRAHAVHDEEQDGCLARHRQHRAGQEPLEVPDRLAVGGDTVPLGASGGGLDVVRQRCREGPLLAGASAPDGLEDRAERGGEVRVVGAGVGVVDGGLHPGAVIHEVPGELGEVAVRGRARNRATGPAALRRGTAARAGRRLRLDGGR